MSKTTIRLFFWLLILPTTFIFDPTNTNAQASSGEFQQHTTVDEKTWAEALRRKAQLGDPEAQFDLSQAYMDGHVFRQDLHETVKWLRAAAEQGILEAQVNLGGLYYLGKGVPQDYSQSAYWTRRAAEKGSVKGEYNLGLMYALGQGVSKSNADAVRWYLKAAEQGHQVAAFDMGVAYSRGMGTPQDTVKGYMWFLLALRFGYSPSQQMLSTLNSQLPSLLTTHARRRAQAWLRSHPDVKGVPL